MLGPLTPQELVFFQSIQEVVSHPFILIYHDPNKILWVNLNISKKFEFGVVVFHTTTIEKLS